MLYPTIDFSVQVYIVKCIPDIRVHPKIDNYLSNYIGRGIENNTVFNVAYIFHNRTGLVDIPRKDGKSFSLSLSLLNHNIISWKPIVITIIKTYFFTRKNISIRYEPNSWVSIITFMYTFRIYIGIRW